MVVTLSSAIEEKVWKDFVADCFDNSEGMTDEDTSMLYAMDGLYDRKQITDIEPVSKSFSSALFYILCGDKPVGCLFITFYHDHDKLSNINTIFIRPEYRRKGVGTEAIRQLLPYLPYKDVYYFHDGNIEGIEFSKRLGFKAKEISSVTQTTKKALEKKLNNI